MKDERDPGPTGAGDEDYGALQAEFDPSFAERRNVVVSLAAWKAAARLRYRIASEQALLPLEVDE